MNGHKVVADTSLIINFFNGRELAGRLVDQRQIWLSSIYLDMPLVTYDRDFEKVKEVSSIILEGS